MTSSIQIKDFMNSRPASFKCGTNLTDIIKGLAKDNLSGAPIVNDDNEVIGYVSEQDCIHSLIEDSYYCDKGTLVNDVMKTEVSTVSPDDSILDLAKQIDNHRPKQYPVVANGKLVGLINRRDIMLALSEQLSHCN